MIYIMALACVSGHERFFSISALLEVQNNLIETLKQEMPGQDYDELSREYLHFKNETYMMLREFERIFLEIDDKEAKIEELENRIFLFEEQAEASRKKVEDLTRQLNAIKNSRLGRLAKKYWAFRKKWFRRMQKR
jgi:septal ring factor EnvC (AmiA/AmiB activator)